MAATVDAASVHGLVLCGDTVHPWCAVTAVCNRCELLWSSLFVLLLQVMQHMSKCFQAIDKLKLDNESPPPGQRPKALGMVSCVGDEYVGFKQPLPLEDKASYGGICSRVSLVLHVCPVL
jgi:hypothetical protein